MRRITQRKRKRDEPEPGRAERVTFEIKIDRQERQSTFQNLCFQKMKDRMDSPHGSMGSIADRAGEASTLMQECPRLG
jgi:hypothetical protein